MLLLQFLLLNIFPLSPNINVGSVQMMLAISYNFLWDTTLIQGEGGDFGLSLSQKWVLATIFCQACVNFKKLNERVCWIFFNQFLQKSDNLANCVFHTDFLYRTLTYKHHLLHNTRTWQQTASWNHVTGT